MQYGGRQVVGFGDAGLAAPVCPALPSGRKAFDLVSGDMSALIPSIAFTAVRAGIIGVGLAVVGERRHLIRNAVAGAVAVEVFVLAWALYEKKVES